MDPSSIRQIIILLILLLLSAFFSSAETALTTVNKHRMRALANQGNKKAGHSRFREWSALCSGIGWRTRV